MTADVSRVDVRIRDVPALRLLVALLCLVSYEGAYQAERDLGETRGDWLGRRQASGAKPLVNVDPDKLCAGRVQIKRGNRWVRA